MKALRDLLQQGQVIVVVGAGGVGKTSVSAALALAAAQQGRRSLVITIDPARRLANALGLDTLGAEAREIDFRGILSAQSGFARTNSTNAGRVKAACAKPGAVQVAKSGQLDAMMLDLKASWDDMVWRLADSPKQARQILANRFYQYLSTELAGAQEYIACEQLYTLINERDYEIIILDTPPSAQAIDFLEAPGRILDLLDDRGLRLILRPSLAAGRASLRLFRLSERYLIRSLSKLAGAQMLSELAEFFALFDGMYEPLRQRTRGFQQIFASQKTSFVVVSTAAAHPLSEAKKLTARLQKGELSLGALVINQVHQSVEAVAEPDLLQALEHGTVDANFAQNLAPAIVQSCQDARRRAEDESVSVQHALSGMPDCARYFLPRQFRDVHDLSSLAAMAQLLIHDDFAATVAQKTTT